MKWYELIVSGFLSVILTYVIFVLWVLIDLWFGQFKNK
jgi:hypothetical protein